MNLIKICFWNLQNLFDTTLSDLALDFDYTPANGWDETVRDIKIDNLVKGISSTFTSGPDLIGMCEIENEYLAQEIATKLNRNLNRNDYSIAKYKDSPDIRGIDTCLIYSNSVFEFIESKSYNMDLRYPTRDIFYVKLKVLQNNSNLHIFVNHWPSRRGKDDSTESDETEFARSLVAENCGKLVDNILKIPKKESHRLPKCLIDCPEYEKDFKPNDQDAISDKFNIEEIKKRNENLLTKLDDMWNENILLMGDFNDEPYNKSLVKFLNATFNSYLLRDWRTIFQLKRKDWRNIKSDREIYLEEKSYLYNCMWKLIPDGTHYFYKTNSFFLFDQFIISQGLLKNLNSLKLDLNSVKIHKNGLSLGSNLLEENFNDNVNKYNKKKLHSDEKGSPMGFKYSKTKIFDLNKDVKEKKGLEIILEEAIKLNLNKNIIRLIKDKLKDLTERLDKIQKDKRYFTNFVQDPNTGFSDHFPIICIIEIN
jgi:Endonuclease/Exonuclease/phosphatase family